MSGKKYTLRLSVKMQSESAIGGLESEPIIEVCDVRISFKQRGQILVLTAADFDSEQEAEAFLPRLKAGLWNLALEHNFAFAPTFARRDITPAEDPVAAARNLAASFGTDGAQSVHGLGDEEGYTVFPSEENIRFLALGVPTVHVTVGWSNAAQTLAAGISRPPNLAHHEDSDLVTALDLYLSSFYETSLRARFLTLMTALEVLAPEIGKHAVAVELIVALHAEVEGRLVRESDPDAIDALEALKREIDFRKETSIRRRIRHLVLTNVRMGDADKKALSKRVVSAYDLRGSLVHNGATDPRELVSAWQSTLQTVKLVLQSRLNLFDGNSAL